MKLNMIVLTSLIFAASIMLTSCSPRPEPGSSVDLVDDVKPLNKKEVAELEALGEAGQGWAYEILSGDAKDAGDDVASQLWSAKALQAGASQSCAKYAEKLLALSRKMENSESKAIILSEAKDYAVTSIKNSFKYPSASNNKKAEADFAIASRILNEINIDIKKLPK